MKTATKPDNVHQLVPKQLRLDWCDLMALDDRLTALAVRAGIVIAVRCIQNDTGVGFIGLDKVATLLKVSRRTAWSAISLLVRHGYLGVKRRGHGKGRANEYELLLDKVQPVARLAHEKLVTRCTLLWGSSGYGLHVAEGVNVQKPASQGAADCTPSLTYPSGSSLKGDFSEREKVADLIRHGIGAALFQSWFINCTLDADGDAAAVLVAPTAFARDAIAQRFLDQVRDAVKAVSPDITTVNIITAKQRRTG